MRGRDLVSGLPKTIVVSTEEIREAIEEPVSAIVDAVKVTLDKTPPELAADIMERGIVITGGGALLARPGPRLESETGMPIVVAENPLYSVVLGSGQYLEEAAFKNLIFAETPLIGPRELSGNGGPSTAESATHDLDSARSDLHHPHHPGHPGRGQRSWRTVRNAARDAFAPVQKGVDDLLGPIGDWWDGVTRSGSIKAENRKLRRELQDHARPGRDAAPLVGDPTSSRRWRTFPSHRRSPESMPRSSLDRRATSKRPSL